MSETLNIKARSD